MLEWEKISDQISNLQFEREKKKRRLSLFPFRFIDILCHNVFSK